MFNTALMLVVMALFVVVGCLPRSGQNTNIEDRLIVAANDVGPGGMINVADAFDREPERIVVIPGYSNQSDVDAGLGFHWDASTTGVLDQDGHLLIATVGDSVVEWNYLSPAVDFSLDPRQTTWTIPLDRSTIVEAVAGSIVLCPAACAE